MSLTLQQAPDGVRSGPRLSQARFALGPVPRSRPTLRIAGYESVRTTTYRPCPGCFSVSSRTAGATVRAPHLPTGSTVAAGVHGLSHLELAPATRTTAPTELPGSYRGTGSRADVLRIETPSSTPLSDGSPDPVGPAPRGFRSPGGPPGASRHSGRDHPGSDPLRPPRYRSDRAETIEERDLFD